MSKPLYKVLLNWFGEVHTLYTHTTTKNAARINAFNQLAKKVGYSVTYVRQNSKDIRITEVQSNDAK